MKRMLFLILLVAFGASFAQNSAFSVISTKILSYYGHDHLFTSFLSPSSTGEYKNLPSNNAILTAPESISDYREERTDAANVAVVKASIDVEPMVGDEIATNTVRFFCFYQVPQNGSGEARGAQAKIEFKILYELKNTSGSSADLYYGINNSIAYMFVGSAAGGQRYYQIGLYESNESGGFGNQIYSSGQLTDDDFSIHRGTAYSNVEPNGTRYIMLYVYAYAASENGGLGIFKVDASHGISVAFDDENIAYAYSMNNDPGMDVNGKMKFKLYNWYASDATGPLMGTTGAHAYNNLGWDNTFSEAHAISENVSVLDGVKGVTVKMDGFELFDFDNFGSFGNESDRRVYINGTAEIYKDGVLKLRLIDCRMELHVSYPNPWGNDAPVTGAGSGMFDTGVSDPAWVNEFNTNGTMRANFVLNSFSTVINNPWYDATITLEPTNYVDYTTGWNIFTGGTYDYSDGYCSFYFTEAASGNAMARMIASNPGGDAPTGVVAISAERYWQFGSTLSEFTVNVSFNLSGVSGINDLAHIRILHREDPDSAWTVLDPATYTIDGNIITVAGISSFSEFGIGSTGGSPLPVELTSFTASVMEGNAVLNWTTATEINNSGFEIQRAVASINSEENWKGIGFVEGNGNSSSPKNYTFVDENPPSGNIFYRLKQINVDGSYEYSEVIETQISAPNKFSLSQNYPNPFNPTTNITYVIASIAKQSTGNSASANNTIVRLGRSHAPLRSARNDGAVQVSLKIYDALGREVATLVNAKQTSGKYSVQFNARELPSGVYFYTLRAGNFVQTKKMILMK